MSEPPMPIENDLAREIRGLKRRHDLGRERLSGQALGRAQRDVRLV
jgi:hypothetical protein